MTQEEKVKLWRERFHGRQTAFGRREHGGEASYSPKFRDRNKLEGHERYIPLEDSDVVQHLEGTTDIMMYLLHEDETIRFAALDFDKKHDFNDVMKCARALDAFGIPRLVARSQTKGHHLYIFFSDFILPKYVLSFFAVMYDEIGFTHLNIEKIKDLPETFPKTTHLGGPGAVGLGIKPALQGTARKKDRCCFVNDEDEVIGGNGLSDKQWETLQNIQLINPVDFIQMLIDKNIPIQENIRIHEKRGVVDDLPRDRTTPYETPTTGDFELVVNACPALKEVWNDGKNASNDSRYGILSMAINTKNGVEALRKHWPSDKTDYHINYAQNRNYRPWSCVKLQEMGVCVKGRHPKMASDKAPVLDGEMLNDYCLDKLKATEIKNGKKITLNIDMDMLPSPSPIRLAYGGSKKQERARKKKKKATAKKTTNKGTETTTPSSSTTTAAPVEPVALEDIFVCLGKEKGYARVNVGKEGDEVLTKISNFTVELSSIVEVANYLGEVTTNISGTIFVGKREGSDFTIPTGHWYNNKQFLVHLATLTHATANYKSRNLDDIRTCINQFGRSKCIVKKGTTEYGFDSYDKPTRYITEGGNVTAEGFDTSDEQIPLVSEANKSLRLKLHEITDEEFDRVCAVLLDDVMNFHDPGIARVCLAHAMQATIHNLCMPIKYAPIVWLHGLTGLGKTTITKMCAALHTGSNIVLANASSTARWMELSVMSSKDALFCIDDYRGKKAAEIADLIQRIYDRSGRGRLVRKNSGEYSLDENIRNRGLVLVNGEDILHMDAAVVSRCMIFGFVGSPTSSNSDRLDRIEAIHSLLPGFTARFVQHILANPPDKVVLKRRYTDVFAVLKGEASVEGKSVQNRDRIASNLAANHIAFEMLMEFFVKEEMLGPSRADKLTGQHWSFLKVTNNNMRAACIQEQASNVFLDTLRALILSGTCLIEGYHDMSRRAPGAQVVGFVDSVGNADEYLYLIPKVCYSQVQRFLTGSGPGLIHSGQAVAMQLDGDGHLLKKTGGSVTHVKKYKMGSHRVWCVRKELLGLHSVIEGGVASAVKIETAN